MVLLPAVEAEFDEIVALVNVAYRGTGANASWNTEAQIAAGPRLTLELLKSDLEASPAAHFLTARDRPDRPILGTVWLDPHDDGSWYLGLLTVHPSQQKRHLGRELLADAERFAKARGAERMRMTVVHVRDTLIAWYERRGYGLTGETKPYPEGVGTPLVEGLHFVVMEKVL